MIPARINRPSCIGTCKRASSLRLDNFGRTRSGLVRHATADTTTTVELPELLPMDEDFEPRHMISSFANWLLPGYVMVGRYPFIEPSRCKDRSQGEEQLDAILRAGITTFVSLQAELPPQKEMPIGGKDGFMPYRATADLIAAGQSGPPPGEVVDGLRNPYLDKYVPPRRREASETYRNYKPLRLQFVNFPIADLSVPTDEPLAEALADLSARLHAGEKLYIHCWGGRGRVGVVSACLLVKLYGVTPDAALERVAKAYSLRNDTKDRSPETDEQVAFVHRFCERFA